MKNPIFKIILGLLMLCGSLGAQDTFTPFAGS